jgi:hypothetical protein
MKKLKIYLIVLIVVVISSCNSNPSSFENVSKTPDIFPDYNEIVIPSNIAPLNFQINESGDSYYVEIKSLNGKSLKIHTSSSSVSIPVSAWRKLLKKNIGNKISVDIYAKNSSGWTKYEPLKITVSEYEIDSYLAYRIINVGYILWKKMGLYQRDLTSFKESPLMLNRNTDANCMNCHSFSNNNPDKFQFHMRGKHGGTVIVDKGKITMLNTKTPYTMSSFAYPSWHPDGKHIAYSVNLINQWFHGVDKRNEVYDRASDIVVYDIEKNMVTTSPVVSTHSRENLPFWSPDGKSIYYISTEHYSDTTSFDSVRYSLLRVGFDVQTNEWGSVDTVLKASDINKSITFPTVSPDGKNILFTASGHGYFTVYDKESDLYIYNLETKQVTEFPYNSEDVDSYHSWSSNGRWIVFSSKRLNGLCTHPWFSFIDEDGKASKPFILPQKDPAFYSNFKDNYNRPELVKGKVTFNEQKLLKIARGKATDVEFDPKVNVDGLSGATKIKAEGLH